MSSLFWTFIIFHEKLGHTPTQRIDMLFMIKALHYWIRDPEDVVAMLQGTPRDMF